MLVNSSFWRLHIISYLRLTNLTCSECQISKQWEYISYLLFGIKSSWNEGIDTCFNVKCVLLGLNFDFLGGYLVVTARYLAVTASYCLLPGGYCSLLVVTARYRWLLLIPTFSMNEKNPFKVYLVKNRKIRKQKAHVIMVV